MYGWCKCRLLRVYFNITQDPRYIVYTRPTRFREIPQVDIHDIHGIHGVKVEPLVCGYRYNVHNYTHTGHVGCLSSACNPQNFPPLHHLDLYLLSPH